ncbi:TIGR02679 family protein [Pseudonocardia spinosispora]|uniref:TIGR02679 family protein n=1 Tax=Pseudonocardia spinosispora TaxID=103441 RepID=UPI0003FC8B3F|nr:TIGR02679 family protein [Pseudonocardia spinosispora]
MRRIAQLSPALGPLWAAAHERLSSGRPVSRVRVGPLTEEQRTAVADLLGLTRLPDEYAIVSMPQLDDVLRSAVGADVREVVGELVGPLGDRARDRRLAEVRRGELWSWFEEHPVVVGQPALRDWVAAVRRNGLVANSVSTTRDVLTQALAVLARLPASGVSLPMLADDVLHDPHGLDEGTRCAGLVLRALSFLYEVEPPTDAARRRAVWERAGVADDELSSTVLAAGLRPAGDDPAARILRVCADAGQAAALTLGQLRSARWTNLPAEVWVFENPSVLALALGRFGRGCPPMVCTSGWPSSAGMVLLRLLSPTCRLYYHGDFDGEGLRIAATVLARTGAAPWRMTTSDYLAGLGEGPPVGRVTEAPWDPDLAAALRESGVAVTEERVASGLLDSW